MAVSTGVIHTSSDHSFSPKNNPVVEATRHITTLRPILSTAAPNRPCCRRTTVSTLKLENVLSPPQKPTPMSSRIDSSADRCIIHPTKAPNMKLATTLTSRIAFGKGELLSVAGTKRPVRYRSKLPAPPPTNTSTYGCVSKSLMWANIQKTRTQTFQTGCPC